MTATLTPAEARQFATDQTITTSKWGMTSRGEWVRRQYQLTTGLGGYSDKPVKAERITK